MTFQILVWNLENFFLDEDATQGRYQKDESKVKAIARVFQELSPDIAFLCEVGLRSLHTFNEKHLENHYKVYIKKGNSPRGIEIGYLVKREFLEKYQLIADLISHANKPINFLYPHELKANKEAKIAGRKPRFSSHGMSRDLAELQLHKKGHAKTTPLLGILGIHLKSRLDKEGQDWHGLRRRTAEANYVAEIYQKRIKRFHNKYPLFICGDFNGEIHEQKRDPEFRAFYHLDGLKDFSDHLSLEREDCVSFVGMDKNKKPIPMQLDAFLFHEKWKNFLDGKGSGFYRYPNEEGGVYPLATSPSSRHGLPSDHYPLVTRWSEQILLPS